MTLQQPNVKPGIADKPGFERNCVTTEDGSDRNVRRIDADAEEIRAGKMSAGRSCGEECAEYEACWQQVSLLALRIGTHGSFTMERHS